jgi:hypothetical protein
MASDYRRAKGSISSAFESRPVSGFLFPIRDSVLTTNTTLIRALFGFKS